MGGCGCWKVRLSLLRSLLTISGLVVWGGSLCPPIFGQPGLHKDPLSWDRSVHRLFSRHCYDCHGADSPSGNVNLASDVDVRLIRQNRKKWLIVLEQLRSGEMPPQDGEPPSPENRSLMIDFLDKQLGKIDCEGVKTPGRPVLRRLNRVEYDNAIFDLTGLHLHLSDRFPPDPISFGFDNVGSVAALTPVQVELSHEAARSCVESLLRSKDSEPEAFLRVFGSDLAGDGDGNRISETEKEDAGRANARHILNRFASRAFRRPVERYFLNRLLRIYDSAIEEKQSHEQAIGHCLTAILISPRFLLRIEMDRPETEDAYRIDDFELASRLSFFLWSGPPDQRLLELARKTQLHEPVVLRAEVKRMLADARSRQLVDNFFFQWLDLRRASRHQPDVEAYPQFDEALRQDMLQEIRLLLMDIVQGRLPVPAVIDSKYIYVNERLANHYGMKPDSGPGFQKVVLADHRRGGVLTAAATLMVQSDPNRSNIPRRGNFIAAQLLGDAPPPPPADVPLLEDSAEGNAKSQRALFEMHRSRPDCKSCHEKIDPIGFSLENFDAIGRWRDYEGEFAINASAVTESGDAFAGPEGLKRYLRSREDEFLETFCSRLLIYALGRGREADDECVVRAMVGAAHSGEGRLSSIVSELVLSVPFTHRRNAEY